MELRQYVGLLRKWLLLIFGLTLLAAVGAFFISRSMTRIYQASTTLMVNQASSPTTGADYAGILTSERLARTYASLLTRRPVLEETAKRVGVGAEHLGDSITVTSVRDTQLLEIKVEGPDPQLIAQIANTLPEVFIVRNQQMQLGQMNIDRLREEIARTEQNLADTQQQLDAATDATDRTRLETSLAQYRKTYSDLIASYQQVQLAETRATNNIVVAEPAVVPTDPIRPRPMTNVLLAAIIGALLAVGIAFLIEYLDDTIKTPDDVQRVAGLSTLGAIARLKEVGDSHRLVSWLNSRAPESEAYRTLRTNLQFSSVDHPVKTLLVTSSSPGEGKSTTASNLAVMLAQAGQQVIIVDADLRRPVLHKVFNVPNNVGLTTALLAGDDATVRNYFQTTEVENLSVLTCGPIPPNPSELLGSHRMGHLISALSGEADIVLFDSPPVLAVTDAAVMGRQVDGILMVADAGKTREHALAQAAAELKNTGGNLLGVTLNRLDKRRGGYSYYYYYYYNDESSERRRSSSRNGSHGVRIKLPWQRKPVV